MRDRITGVLLLSEDGVSCQVIKGAFAQMDSRLSRICNDPRHTDVRVLRAVLTHRRRYPGWPTGLAEDRRGHPRLEILP